MASKQHLPADLSPTQVSSLQDALLANADRLLQAALTMLNSGDMPLARSLAILGMEESGKAIALHQRRSLMAYAPEGEAFVDQPLVNLWAQHVLKLEVVHEFLVREDYWFDTQPPDPDENARVLGTIEEWKNNHNALKQRGFYVDVTPDGDPITPMESAEPEAVRAVIDHLHQISWQLRLGEHIEGKNRLQVEQNVPPVTEEEIKGTLRLLRNVDPAITEDMIVSMRKGTEGKKLNNAAYAFHLPSNPFENVGRPGYEAHDRELWMLFMERVTSAEETTTSDD